MWRYDGTRVSFYELDDGQYREIPESISFARLTPAMLDVTLDQKAAGRSATLRAFRNPWAAVRGRVGEP